MAAILAAGLDGVKDRRPLRMRSIEVAAAKMSDEDRRKHRVSVRMPGSMEAAHECLLKDKVILGALGRELVDVHVAVNKVSAWGM